MVVAGLSPRWLLHLLLLLLDGGLLVLLQWCFWWCFFVEDSAPAAAVVLPKRRVTPVNSTMLPTLARLSFDSRRGIGRASTRR